MADCARPKSQSKWRLGGQEQGQDVFRHYGKGLHTIYTYNKTYYTLWIVINFVYQLYPNKDGIM
jgi:hypothetical protein